MSYEQTCTTPNCTRSDIKSKFDGLCTKCYQRKYRRNQRIREEDELLERQLQSMWVSINDNPDLPESYLRGHAVLYQQIMDELFEEYRKKVDKINKGSKLNLT